MGDSRSMDFKLHDIEDITNNFAEEQKVGSGEYGDVYTATYQGEEIAVKKLHPLQGLDDKQLYSEFRNLGNIRHQNVVRLIGYCYETRHKYVEHNGELVFATSMERVLCYEYMQGGSLHKYIQGEACALEWPTCYKIIKGTCEGINYLHSSQGKPIFHLNLKPSNILLDRSMTPKIADLGLSRIVASTKTHQTEMRNGTLGFMPPEYVDNGYISKKFDVFSLGIIIIKMLAGDKNSFLCAEMSPEQFIELVTENWTKRLQALMRYSIQEDILRVRTCVEIALRCVDSDRNKRPSMNDIVRELEELEANITVMSYLIVQTGSKPHQVSLQHLKDITANFSEDRILGRGGFGVVYKGLLQNGELVAVKKLVQSTPKSQKQFENEVDLLMTLKHPNVVRLLDYCYDTQHLLIPYEGKFVPALNIERLLCLEYMPNGSLDKYITVADAPSALDWQTRCKIIEGISIGLRYLHEGSNVPIIHLDLKPANILLDEDFVPKITDFGLSRLFDPKQTINTAAATGTLGYMSLEYQLRGTITPMADIFSLGVIIMEIITGHRDYPYDIRKSSKDFIKQEMQKWRNKLQKEPGYTTLEIDCQQIERYIQIGLICVNDDRSKRPTMKKIIDMLQGVESMNSYIRNELSSDDIQEGL
ncbi:G-type lectin S-receptor-like serine/threonine-protein kinase SD1-13 [Triticum dicoccoides]|uniref:G-type lectin S-receptor-like serine/threonine-protein kinase SD1-13 n=1 Tax=Triticum dicoccoides TaxID=85692 RepID=UPI00188ED988|nr:G-type lectin S-receptor-like serine/threonine-protein kinase SD1-13 [Triticum dicoccoides]XP_037482806.1 G-type lectin S-receptor-like serine/threonine-protein kinase SD1-13 [Triticum dicoccoides]XP_037482807.1 G-type lectin S-receptor-like serine/threonine-protein kinase SD1-13 [Triticum dicoccoides]XP_037482809.1 G-type lectin S-receptor-like serine/threonine-protein kinase SD1-13 [Triticum dicoccoides]